MAQKPEPKAPPKASAKAQQEKMPPPQASDAELRDITDDLHTEAEFAERRGFAWNQKIRLLLAILVVIVSACLLWWMVS
ncbi:MAG: hypothetical protein J5846_07295 [Desulfovibrio sp.]|nr:hypothetical protein [Desulfovibrio sp.]